MSRSFPRVTCKSSLRDGRCFAHGFGNPTLRNPENTGQPQGRPRGTISMKCRSKGWLQARNPSQNCANLADGSVAARDRRIKQMSRRCHQEGHVRLRDDVKRPCWRGLYRVQSGDQPGVEIGESRLQYCRKR